MEIYPLNMQNSTNKAHKEISLHQKMAKRKPAKTQCFCGSGGERWYLCSRGLGDALCRLAKITTYQEIHALKMPHWGIFLTGFRIHLSFSTIKTTSSTGGLHGP